MLPTLAALASFAVAAAIVRFLTTHSIAGAVLDVPNERSSHSEPVPRVGGLGMLAALVASWLVFAPLSYAAAVIGACVLSAISFVDDAGGLSVRARLMVHALVALAFLAASYEASFALLPLAFLALVWMQNLYNFMDGSDGLAGGMAVSGFGAYAVAAGLAGSADLSILAASVAGAAAGFLIWNFHKARIFMGDSGSVPLGFLAAAIGILGWQQDLWPVWFPFLVFSPFIADATVTLLRRWLRGDEIAQAHRTHYYQRLLRMGLGHRSTALCGYALMIAVALSALMARTWSPVSAALLLGGWAILYAVGMWHIDRLWAAFELNNATESRRELNAPS